MEAYLAGLFTGTVLGFVRAGRWVATVASLALCAIVVWLLVERGADALTRAVTQELPALVGPHAALIGGALLGLTFGIALDRRLSIPAR